MLKPKYFAGMLVTVLVSASLADTDDGKSRKGKSISNDLHYSGEGYKLLGKRFAEEALKLIDKKR